MEGFLPFIKKIHISHAANAVDAHPEQLFFQIGINKDKQAFVDTINDKGMTITPDYHSYSGETFHVLRSIHAIREKQQEVFSWETKHGAVLLKEYPYLMHQLLKCKNLKNGNLQDLSVAKEQATPLLMLDKQGSP